MQISISPCASLQQVGWLALRQALWPHCTEAEHLEEMAQFIAEPDRYGQFVAYADPALPVGFIEVSRRTDYVNGTSSSPVAFIEGIYVAPAYRCQGVARALVTQAEAWAIQRGCQEIASDADLDNEVSQRAHQALGFEETERVVYFRKGLVQPG